MADAAEASPQLSLTTGHQAGHTSAAWYKSDGTWHTVTAGRDSRVVTRHPRNNQEIKSVEGQHGGWNCLVTSPDCSMVAGVDDQYVKVWNLPELTAPRTAVGRLVGTPRCCCWDKDSTMVAAAGDDSAVQVVTVKDAKLKHKVKNEGFTRGLALDPEGQYLAAANADGTVSVWDIKQDPVKQEHRKKLGPKFDHDDHIARQGLAWHPDGGTLLAVAGQDNDVVLLERLSWTPVSYLAGGHDGNVGVVTFSPNGVYAATAGTDNKVVVWSVDKAVQVAARQLSCMATSLSWHPQNNALLIGGSDGGVGLWSAPVPEFGAGDHKMPSPWLPVDDLLKEADRAAADVSKGAGASFDDLEDDMDDDEVAHIIQRRGLHGKAAGAGPATSGGNGPSASDLLDQLDAATEEAAAFTSGQGYKTSTVAPAAAGHTIFRPKPPQPPIHPGSSPAGTNGSARFLAYNQLGCVVSKAVEDHHTIEVTFHDTSLHRLRVPLLTDYFNFSAASMSTNGVAYISPAAGAEQPSMLVWRGFESWASGADWTAAMPEGEEALVVAAGPTAVAVGTSQQLLRIYSTAGRQIAVLSLPGQPVAMAAADPGHILEGGVLQLACQHHLAVVWAREGPNPVCGTQRLEYMVFDVARCSKEYSGQVVLSSGGALSWLAFTKEGLLATMDSLRVLRVRTPDWGGGWVPVLDATGAKARAAAEQFWPTWMDTSTLLAVVTSIKVPYPQVSPRPLITSIPLAISAARAEATPAEAEEAALLAGLKASQIRALSEYGSSPVLNEDLATYNEATYVEGDKTALRLFTAYLKAGKQTRALELVAGLHQTKSVEGTLRIANHFHLPQLAERITVYLEDKIQAEEEEEQPQQHWTSMEMPLHQDNQEDTENVQPEEPSAAQPSTKDANASAFGKMIPGGSKATSVNQKRKTPPIALSTIMASEGKANPFARKKIAK